MVVVSSDLEVKKLKAFINGQHVPMTREDAIELKNQLDYLLSPKSNIEVVVDNQSGVYFTKKINNAVQRMKNWS